MDVAVSHHQFRHGIEIMIDKWVTEMTEETQENHIDDIGDSTGKLVAKARLKQTPMPTTSSPTVTLRYDLRD